MPSEKQPFPILAIRNPNKAWVSQELEKLIDEWKVWEAYCKELLAKSDSPDYDPNTCSEAIKDGHQNRRKHELLREKTLVFLRNHFSGAEFVYSNWRSHPYESSTERLSNLAPVWVHRLEILRASMGYVQVPDGFWGLQGKKLLESLSKSTSEGAIEVAKSYLKNPLSD